MSSRRGTRATAALAIGLALSLLTSAVPAAGPGAIDGICNSKGGTANFNFTVKDIDGRDVALNAYKGKVVLLDFWATWCPPCRKEIPGFIELYDKYRSQGFVVLGVSMDDSSSDVKRFIKRFKMNYPVLMGSGREDLLKAYGGPEAFPVAFIIGRDGAICTQHMGLAPLDEFERKIRALL